MRESVKWVDWKMAGMDEPIKEFNVAPITRGYAHQLAGEIKDAGSALEKVARLGILAELSPVATMHICIMLLNTEKEPIVLEKACTLLADSVEQYGEAKQDFMALAKSAVGRHKGDRDSSVAIAASDSLQRLINADLKRLGIRPEQRINYPGQKQKKGIRGVTGWIR